MLNLTRAVAIILASALVAAAQSPEPGWNSVQALAAGAEVRVKLDSRTIRGQIQNVTGDALTLNSAKGQEAFTRQEVLSLSVKKKGHRGRDTLIGLGAGAAVGLVVGAVSDKQCTGWCVFEISRGEAAAIGAILFGAIGTAVGALIIPTGGWREVYKK
jgi:hypothetical protein